MIARKRGDHTQRELVQVLVPLIDAAMAKGATAHRDLARIRLREMKTTENWNTAFVCNNISTRRCRYLASLGWPVPSRWLIKLKLPPEDRDAPKEQPDG